MSHLKSNKLKITTLVGITMVVFAIWQLGFEKYHAKFILTSANVLYKITGSKKFFEFEKIDGKSYFWAHTIVEGRKAKFNQKIGSVLQPTVMILAWQLFLFLVMAWRKALRLLLVNLGAFVILQVVFLLQLMGYHTSATQRFLYEFFISSFYVIALVFIIKDQYLYQVFKRNPQGTTP